eukprot:3637538-Rhodomonas_salina.1
MLRFPSLQSRSTWAWFSTYALFSTICTLAYCVLFPGKPLDCSLPPQPRARLLTQPPAPLGFPCFCVLPPLPASRLLVAGTSNAQVQRYQTAQGDLHRAGVGQHFAGEEASTAASSS